MLFLYDFPNWLLGVYIVSAVVALSFTGYFAFQRFVRPSFTGEHVGVAMAVLSAVATVNSLLLAFSAVSVWESFGSAEASVVSEANSVSALARDLAVFDSKESREARRLLREYAAQVIEVEWGEMRRGQASSDVWTSFDRIFSAVGEIEPDTPRRVALLPEIWARTNELLKQRRSRLFTSASQIPGTLWTVAVCGTVLTILTSFVLPPTRFHLCMIAVLVLSMGLVFFLLVAMDRPFAGEESISPGPFQIAIQNMQRWDARVTSAGAR